MSEIVIEHACEGNLKDVTLRIPKNKLVVFTGVSGSGKSTLLLDVLFNECQRQYLEAMGMQGIRKPRVGRVRGASPAVYITQTDANRNPRSTVGTVTDIYTGLRMVYEKLAVRACPHCGQRISAADCREVTEKVNGEFHVYMDCCACGARMPKLTRTEFSFNTREGACPACEGLGRVHQVRRGRAVDEALPPEGGAVRYWEKQYAQYQAGVLYKALAHYGAPAAPGTPVARYSPAQKAVFYEGADSPAARQAFPGQTPPKTAAAGRFEGVLPILWRRLAEKQGDAQALEPYFEVAPCPQCGGERLAGPGRLAEVAGVRLPQLAAWPLQRLRAWLEQLRGQLPPPHLELVRDYLLDLDTKLGRLLRVGLGYLALDRQAVSLSGGEAQRMRLAAALDCELTGLLYMLDEPTAGLHPQDTAGLVDTLQKLRDLGNTVLVIEHDPDVMARADQIIDLGPGAGRRGGRVVAQGTLEQVRAQPASATGQWLRSPPPGKTAFRPAAGGVHITGARRFNLQGVDVCLPAGCLTAVTGPSGSGKSTLVFEVLARGQGVSGLEQFGRVVQVGQAALARSKRSNVATYCGVYADIRAVFARTPAARAAGLGAGHFSFNSPGGRCERCEGLGTVASNLLFFADAQVACPVCGGARFGPQVLAVAYQGLDIRQVLELPVEQAARVFAAHPRITAALGLLQSVGLGYLQLGQALTTLSGGEAQRLKLARELAGAGAAGPALYLLDEPTAGLHPQDVRHFLALLDRLVDAGNTVVVVEHDRQLIRHSDWVVDLGPGGGEQGGRLMFAGTPAQLLAHGQSATARCLQGAAK